MINYIKNSIDSISQVLSLFLGITVLVLGAYVIITGNHPNEIVTWSISILGLSFVITLLILTFGSIFCIFKLKNLHFNTNKFWFETGVQFANSISTLALTFTLLGISLGIGELAISKLDINSINATIGKLTNKFSMAFLTSVIGLPLSSLLRSILIIIFEYNNLKKESSFNKNNLTSRSI
ncbi:hypothetical protein OBA40_08145 [Alphaproteobacteria bacterium]|nr:hypothetical protein [Alphaproteobacteria bacterium]